jgi:hypothetical protein
MATYQELADDYVSRLRRAQDEEAEIGLIAEELNSLIYTETRLPLTLDDKLSVVALMQGKFSISKKAEGKVGILKEADNKRYLDLVKALRELLS